MVENGAIIGDVDKSRLVVYKQRQQEFTATNKKNIITEKFHRKRYNIYNNNHLLQTCETTSVIDYFCCRCGD